MPSNYFTIKTSDGNLSHVIYLGTFREYLSEFNDIEYVNPTKSYRKKKTLSDAKLSSTYYVQKGDELISGKP